MIRFIRGNRTEEDMKLLEINEYPFSETELKINFRKIAFEKHPDHGGDGKEFGRVHEAYERLLRISILFHFKKEGKKVEEEEIGLFELKEKCNVCGGLGHRTIRVPISEPCNECGGSGRKTLKCKYCENGLYKMKNSGIRRCRVCLGTGIWKTVICRRCFGDGKIQSPFVSNMVTKECEKCGGTGKIDLNLFNPVIEKGAILV